MSCNIGIFVFYSKYSNCLFFETLKFRDDLLKSRCWFHDETSSVVSYRREICIFLLELFLYHTRMHMSCVKH